jgi:hypothetical protein
MYPSGLEVLLERRAGVAGGSRKILEDNKWP